jgi:hypothetical protein
VGGVFRRPQPRQRPRRFPWTKASSDHELAGSAIAPTLTATTGTLAKEADKDLAGAAIAPTLTPTTGTLAKEAEKDLAGSAIAPTLTVTVGELAIVVPGAGGPWSISKGLHVENGHI